MLWSPLRIHLWTLSSLITPCNCTDIMEINTHMCLNTQGGWGPICVCMDVSIFAFNFILVSAGRWIYFSFQRYSRFKLGEKWGERNGSLKDKWEPWLMAGGSLPFVRIVASLEWLVVIKPCWVGSVLMAALGLLSIHVTTDIICFLKSENWIFSC